MPTNSKLPAEQERIRAKCFHHAQKFTEFLPSEIEQSIPFYFERQAATHADRLAVCTRQQKLSYRDLDQSANRIAHALLAKYSATAKTIALLLGHDGCTIASLLGVMKTGKCCVPLDPTSPPARIQKVLDDSQASVIVTNSFYVSLAEKLAHGTVEILNVNALDSDLSDANIDITVTPDALAFILYTSGSTGQPKGVPQTHRNALHSAGAYINNLHIEADDRLTLLGSCSGGQGMKIVISALLCGAALYPWDIAEEGLANLASWIRSERITIYISGAAVFRSFAANFDETERFPALRVVRIGNEPVRRSDVDLYKKYFSPECIFVNWFALTEAGNLACYFLDKQTQSTEEIIPIGYPFDDTGILVLDDLGQPAEFGQTGEFAIRSRFLSPGYWLQPDLTRTKFLRTDTEERIFLSGDLGFMMRDGLFYHVGRKDFQLKIRGNRLEVGEIEAALLALDGIREAAVIAENQLSDIRLIAYVVAAGEATPTAAMLRQALAERLPQHMIPAAFVLLDAMPVTSNGKIDRGALRTPEQAPVTNAPVAARTDVEKTLVRIWAEAIGISQVGIYDNFFELGGHSLAAVQIVSRAIKEFGVEMPLQSLFSAPTVAEMAQVISASRGKKLNETEINRILTELESLTEEEAQRLTRGETSKGPNAR